MTNKEKFIEVVEGLFEENDIQDEQALKYLENLKNRKSASRSVEMTENGRSIIGYMQEANDEFDNKFLSKEIAEGLFTSSRSVSGAMRKLVTDGYVDKSDDSPIVYSLSDLGKEYKLD